MKQVYEKAVSLFPRESDFDYGMGQFYAAKGQAVGGL